MNTLLLLLVAAAACALFANRRARRQAVALGGIDRLSALPGHYAICAALWCLLPALAVYAMASLSHERLLLWHLAEDLRRLVHLGNGDPRWILQLLQTVAAGGHHDDALVLEAAQRYAAHGARLDSWSTALAIAIAIASGAIAWLKVAPVVRARHQLERFAYGCLLASTTVAVLATVGIVLSVLFESLRFFAAVSPLDFLFGLQWSPQLAMRDDQQGSSGAFGVVPLFLGTLVVSAVAMTVALPAGLLGAIHMSEYASPRARNTLKPLIEVLVGIPTVVYGFIAALSVAPLVKELGGALGLAVASENALAAGLVMGIMIMPFVLSLSDDVIRAVPNALREGALALGATRAEMITQVVLPAALPGIIGGGLLAISRAIGETMIVVMAAGLAAKLSANPLDAMTTVTVQIVTLLLGDQAFDNPKTLAAFALGLTLFVTTLALNIAALLVVRRYHEAYD